MPGIGKILLVLSLAVAASPGAFAQDPPKAPEGPPQKKDAEQKKDGKDQDQSKTQEVLITGRTQDLTGVAESATEGRVGQTEIENRVIQRAGETLETVPGLIVTQHSGSGKANQYFLRGFNLDHGTDFATWVNGMPINMPTHAHGQGYTDLNFLIPELIQEIDFRKGPYYAEEGDFSAAGAIHMEYFTRMDKSMASVTLGSDGYARGLSIGSVKAGDGNLLYGVEGFHDDGPWDNPENYVKQNVVLRYSEGDAQQGWNVTAMLYRGTWNSTDQIAKRAVDQGQIGRFGALDPTDGGRSHRYSLSGEWHAGDATEMTRAHAYLIDYQLALISNFTYFLEDRVNGDQFEQVDRRLVLGGDIAHDWFTRWWGAEEKTTLGLETRNDWIRESGLFDTAKRAIISTRIRDSVMQDSVSPYLQNSTQWNDWFRTVAGIRGDLYHFHVHSNLAANSGDSTAAIASPKLSLVLGPWEKTEFYLNGGFGFHSNDGRGTTVTQSVDRTGAISPEKQVNALVRAKGVDVGVRNTLLPGLQSTLSVYALDIDSELVFSGDAGTTDAGRPSRRVGIEWGNYYVPFPWLTLDADFAYARARFKDHQPLIGNHIPGAVEGVFESGAYAALPENFFASLRFRYFGPRPLIEDNSVRSKSTSLLNGRLGYAYKNVTVAFEVLNILDQKADQIDYFYTSRLPGEPAGGVNDVHFHPVEPREYRIGVTVQF